MCAALLADDLLELPGRVAAAELRREEDSRRIWEAIERLTEAQSQTEAALRAMAIELNRNSGDLLEMRVERKLDRYLAEILAMSEPIESRLWSAAGYRAEEAGALTANDRREVSAADVLAAGIDARGKQPACAVLEVSMRVHTRDIERAERRAKLLLQALRAAIAADPGRFQAVFSAPPAKAFAVVVGRTISEQGRREAERRGVFVVEEEGGYDWEER